MPSISFRTMLVAGALCATSLALAQAPAPARTASTSKGEALVDAKGLTLYVFDRDAPDTSNCNGPCATNWPPLAAAADAKPAAGWTVVARQDGSRQWAYKTKPLYTWSKDTQPGDVTGDGFNQVWHIARP